MLIFAAFFTAPIAQLLIQRFGIAFSIHIPIFAALLVVLMSRGAHKGQLPKPDLPIMIYFVSVFFLVCTALFSQKLPTIMVSFIRQCALLLPYVVLLLAFRQNKFSVIPAVRAFVFGNILGAMFAFYMLASGEIYYSGRLTYAEEYNPTVFGANISAALLLIPWLRRERQINGFIAIIAAGILLAAIILSQARNSLISLFMATLIFFSVYAAMAITKKGGALRITKTAASRLSRGSVMVGALIAVLVAVFMSVDIDDRYFRRLSDTISMKDSAAATANRSWIWQYYLSLDLQTFGYGFDNTSKFLDNFNIQHFPHNAFILTLVQGGIPFFLVYLLFWALVFHISWRKVQNESSFAVLLILFLFFLNFGNDVYQYTYFWIPLALALACVRFERSSASS
jgi:hypothetical protein